MNMKQFTRNETIHEKWDNSREMRQFTGNETIHEKWDNSREMRQFTRNETIHEKWDNSREMRQFTRNETIHEKWDNPREMRQPTGNGNETIHEKWDNSREMRQFTRNEMLPTGYNVFRGSCRKVQGDLWFGDSMLSVSDLVTSDNSPWFLRQHFVPFNFQRIQADRGELDIRRGYWNCKSQQSIHVNPAIDAKFEEKFSLKYATGLTTNRAEVPHFVGKNIQFRSFKHMTAK